MGIKKHNTKTHQPKIELSKNTKTHKLRAKLQEIIKKKKKKSLLKERSRVLKCALLASVEKGS